MPDGFKAGQIPPPGEGQDGSFEDSMAASIESAFENAWQKVHGSSLPQEGKRERRVLFVAVARGVLTYLREHDEAGLEVDLTATQVDGQQITSSETESSRSERYGGGIDPDGIDVIQDAPDSGSGNRVKVTGTTHVTIKLTD